MANINKVGSSSGQQNVTHQESLRLAVQYHIAGDLSEAESIYRQILQTDPNQPEALNLLGLIAQQAGKIDIAVNLIKKATILKPGFTGAHSNLGLALQDLGKREEAFA